MNNASAAQQALAEQLLNAHIAFIKQQISTDQSTGYAQNLIDFCLREGQLIQLEQLVKRESVKQVVQIYAFELNVGGGLLELIGAISQHIYLAAHSHSINLHRLISDQLVAQWLEKLLELKQMRTLVHQAIETNPAIQHFTEQLIALLLKRQLPDIQHFLQPLFRNRLTDKIANGKKINQIWLEQREKLVTYAGQQLSELIHQQIQQMLLLEPAELKDLIFEIWQTIKYVPLNQFYAGLNALDIEEFLVIGYESWRHLRQTDFIQDLVFTGIDVFFETYGNYPVVTLLEEIGITRQHLLNDAKRFLPQAIEMLNRHHILDQLIRMQLQDFYYQPATLQLIKHHIKQ